MGSLKKIHARLRMGLPVDSEERRYAGLLPSQREPTEKEVEAARRDARSAVRAAQAAAEKEAAAERRAIAAAEEDAEDEARRYALERWGRPRIPTHHTGWYQCEHGDGFYRIGGGPWPDFRPPGCYWRREWNGPKPDDVPWLDELPTFVPYDPGPPPSTAAGRAVQASLFGD